MRAISIVRKICRDCLQQVHAARFAAVMVFVETLLRIDRLSLTSIGRALPGCPKHQIKRADYMLGNARLHRELTVWYAALARFVVGTLERPVILVDWTQVAGDFYALSATMPFDGRSLPIYHEVHPRRRYGNRRVQERFLKQLRAMLPPGCKPIIVADAGFKSPFFLACTMNRFDYVVRLRGKAKIWKRGDFTEARTLKQLFGAATVKPQCLGEWTPYDSARRGICSRIVLAARPARDKRKSRGRAHYRRGAREPWVLATSLGAITAERVVALYATRMKIEETFRDLKDPRFGWALSFSASRSAARYGVLLLLASLALVAVMLAGAAAAATDLRRRYQANTTTHRRVLSLFTLGRLVVRELDSRLRLDDVAGQLAACAAYVESLVSIRKREQRFGVDAPHDVACPACGRGWVR